MKPAARVGDLHSCPMVDPGPHVGGPILAPGCKTVLICGAPAARGSSGASINPEMFSVPEDKAQLIRDNAQHILNAANFNKVDPRTLAAIILRENLDNNPVKEWAESQIGFIAESWPMGKPSIGLAQIQVATARFIEEQGLIKPMSDEIAAQIVIMNANMVRETRLENNAINAMYAAAYLRYFTVKWYKEFPTMAERPDILGTLYNIGHEVDGKERTPRPDPDANDFGRDVERLMPLMGHLLGVACGDGDYARCNGTLDQVETASTTVFFGGLPAARVGDTTCHKGVVVSGCPTVLLGD